MFIIFGKFNQLFFRPSIQSAIQEYQQQLVDTVQKDMDCLQKKYLQKYASTSNCKLSNIRDIPNVSGNIIWIKQIASKMSKLLQKLQNVLGQSGQDMKGNKLKEKGEMILQQLNTQMIIDEWQKKAQLINSQIDNKQKIFDIQEKKKKGALEVVVNFDGRLVQLFKETRILSAQKEKLATSLKFMTDDVNKIYPFSISMEESLKTYKSILAKVDASTIELIAKLRGDVQTCIQQGLTIHWGMKQQIQPFTKKFYDTVNKLEEMVNIITEKSNAISSALASIQTCKLDYATLSEKLELIQKQIDELNLVKVSNLQQWVDQIESRLCGILTEKLTVLISQWVDEFEHFTLRSETFAYIKQTTQHELQIKDNIIYINPPIEFARFYWLREFHRCIGIICALPKLEASRFEIHLAEEKATRRTEKNYQSLLYKIEQSVLIRAYQLIEGKVQEAQRYVQTWLSYRSLWKIDIQKVYAELGEDIAKWQSLLNDIKQGRSTFDNSDTDRMYGPILIDYRLVQAKINNKYDQWHQEILNHFGQTFGEKMKSFFRELQVGRNKLEKVMFANASADIMQFITDIKFYKEKYQIWNVEMDSFRNGQKLLDRQRYKVPEGWLWLDQVESDWQKFRELVNAKTQQFEKEQQNLQKKIIADEQILEKKIQEIEEMWGTQKPENGDQVPVKALDILNIIDTQLKRVFEDYKRCCLCKELLNLEPGNLMKLEHLEEDVVKLKEVWSELHKIWQEIESVKEQLLTQVTAKKLKESVDTALKQLNELPVHMNSYECYEKMRARLKQYQKMNRIIINLKNESVKERHWQKLLRELKIQGSFTELTVQQLQTEALLNNEKKIEDIQNVARGELVLEEMLKKIKENWNSFELGLIRYQSKCKLIRGWDELFQQLDEDLSNLSSMKISPYYKTFEEEIQPWDERLQRIRLTLDTWIDVQRRWVYLESIFFGSSDIKTQLMNEFTRFNSIDNEFTSLMKKVAARPLLLDVMNISGLQKTLERLADMLDKIQKALGNYLKKQRSAFARFYFVGDEDLLEIIGNSKDVKNVQKHFNKMYAGITTLDTEKSEKGEDLVTGMNSREGENVRFAKHVNITEDPRINEWLTKVDDQMRNCLAVKLENTLQQISVIEGQKGQEDRLLPIIEQFPAQIVLLSLQVLWCTRVEAALPAQQLPEVVEYIIR